MVKFTAAGDGKILIGLGLLPGNISRMQAGQPVIVKLADLGFQGEMGKVQIMIFTDKDEETMYQKLKRHISSDTIVHRE